MVLSANPEPGFSCDGGELVMLAISTIRLYSIGVFKQGVVYDLLGRCHTWNMVNEAGEKGFINRECSLKHFKL